MHVCGACDPTNGASSLQMMFVQGDSYVDRFTMFWTQAVVAAGDCGMTAESARTPVGP